MLTWILSASVRATGALVSTFVALVAPAGRLISSPCIARPAAAACIVALLTLGGCFRAEETEPKAFCAKSAGAPFPPNYSCQATGGFTNFPGSGGASSGGSNTGGTSSGGTSSGGTSSGGSNTGGMGLAGETGDCSSDPSLECLGGMGGETSR